MKNWKDLKTVGSDHYKSGDIEPIDLFRAGSTFHDFAISSIIKYAFRNRKTLVGSADISEKDMRKIIHYAELLIALHNDFQKREPMAIGVIGGKAE